MNTDLVAKLFKSFESIAHREGDVEYWRARELMALLGYSKWSNFERVLGKARWFCEKAGHLAPDHIAGADKMVELAPGVLPRNLATCGAAMAVALLTSLIRFERGNTA